MATLLAVAALELHTEARRDTSVFWLYLTAAIVLCVSVMLMRFAIKESRVR